MAYNFRPIFTNVPLVSGCIYAGTSSITKDLSGASTPSTGEPFGSGASAGTNAFLVFKAGSPEGAYLQKIRFKPQGTNVATVARIFVNNGSATTVAANNVMYDEISLPATTLTESAALPVFELPLNFAIPTGYRVYVTLGTTVAAGYAITVIGGSYTAS
jgi:hypothetical protein